MQQGHFVATFLSKRSFFSSKHLLITTTSGQCASPHKNKIRQLFGALVFLFSFLLSSVTFAADVSISPSPSYTGSYTVSWTTGGTYSNGFQGNILMEKVGSGSWADVITPDGATSKSYSGQSNNTYSYRMYGYIYDGWSFTDWYSTEASVTVTLTPPTPGAITFSSLSHASSNGDNNGAFTVNWGASSGATAYQLQQRLNSGSWSTIHNGSGTSKSRSGLGNGTYQYRVRACIGSNCSSYSATKTVYVAKTPGVPSSISVSPNPSTNGSYTVSWGSSSGSITKYDLNQQVNGGSWSNAYDGTALSKAYSGQGNGTYKYAVRGCKTTGSFTSCSGWRYSSVATVTLPPSSTGSISFSSLSHSASSGDNNGAFTVSWGAATGTVTAYQLQQRLNGGSWSTVHNATGTSKSRSGLGNGTYDFRVRACNGGACSSYSAVKTVYVALTPGVPSSISVSPTTSTNGSHTVSWGTATGSITQYQLYRSLDGGSYTSQYSGTNTATSFSSLGNGSYVYRVRACKTTASYTSCSGYRTASAATITDPAAPGAISFSGLSHSGSSGDTNGAFTVSWGTASGTITAYQLEQRFNSGSWSTIHNASGTSKSVSGLGNGTYEYRVKACNGSSCSSYSNIKTVYVALTPGIPSSISASPDTSTNGSHVVAWGSASGSVSSYDLNRQIDSGSWLNAYDGVALSKSYTGQSNGSYRYQVRACQATGSFTTCSGYRTSATAIITSPPVALPTAVDPVNDTLGGSEYLGVLRGEHSVNKQGAFNYRIPVEVPPGINGVQPELSLSYSNHRGNGLLGWGWSLSGLSKITRCPASLVRDGYVSGINPGDNYKYCLDGKRLVEIAANEYRTERENFAKIVKSANSWVAYKRDGTKMEYGGITNARQEDGESSSYSWHLNKVTDLAGNYFTINYEKNTSATGVHRPESIAYTQNDSAQSTDYAVHFVYETRPDKSIQYRAGSVLNTDKRLQRIEISAQSSVLRSYEFTYAGYDGNTYADPGKTSRLAEVQLCYESTVNCADPIEFDWTSRTSSDFQTIYDMQRTDVDFYSAGSDDRIFFSPEMYDSNSGNHHDYKEIGDINGDMIPDLLIMRSSSAGYEFYIHFETAVRQGSGGNTDGGTVDYSLSEITSLLAGYGSDPNLVQLPGTLTTTQVTSTFNSTTRTSYSTLSLVQSLDINSDGYLDIYIMDTHGAWGAVVYLFNPDTQSFVEASTSSYSLTAAEVQFQVVGNCDGFNFTDTKLYTLLFRDINGDGLVDVLRYAPSNPNPYQCSNITHNNLNSLDVALNTGNGFQAFTSWGQTSLSFRRWMQIGDVNGDKLPDIIGYKGEVLLNSGSQFVSSGDWPTLSGFYESADDISIGVINYPFNTLDRVMDMNNDGLTDIVVFRDQGIYAYLSTGDGFANRSLWSSEIKRSEMSVQHNCMGLNIPNTRAYLAMFRFADINADRLPDLLVSRLEQDIYELAQEISNQDPFAVCGIYTEMNAQSGWLNIAYGVEWSRRLEIAFSEGAQFSNVIVTNGNIEFINYVYDSNNGSFLDESHNFLRDRDLSGTPDLIGANPLTENRIETIDNGFSNVSIEYEALGHANVYSASDGFGTNAYVAPINSSLQVSSETLDNQPNQSAFYASNQSVVKDPLFSRFVVAKVHVSDGVGGTNTQSYHYHDGKVHLSGYGSLGFAKIEQTDEVGGPSQIRKRVSEYSQVVETDYALIGQLLKQTTYATDTAQGVLQKLSETDNRWKVRVYSDDYDTGFNSPHFFPYLYNRVGQQWDLDGSSIKDSATQHYLTGSLTCSPSAPSTIAVAAGSSADSEYDLDGNLLYSRTTNCDAGASSAAVTATATHNTDITQVKSASRWVLGLIEAQDSIAWSGSSTGNVDTQTRQVANTYNSLGQLASHTIEPNNSLLQHTTTYSYDNYGLISSITENWSNTANDGLDFTSRTTAVNTSYDSSGIRTETTTNALSQTETRKYHAAFGLLMEETDVNGLTTAFTYDNLGRVSSVLYPDNTTRVTDYRQCNNCFSYNNHAAWYAQTKQTGETAVRTFFDGLDREIGSRHTGLTGTYVYQYQTYNSQGLMHKSVDPFFAGDAQQATLFSYDTLNRVTNTVFADNSTEATQYNGLTHSTTNRLGQNQTRRQNSAGWMIQSVDNVGTPVDFTYWPFGELKTTKVNNNSGTQVSLQYDDLGRKTQLNDPNTGTINYLYNPLGLLARETDGKGQVTQYHYDKLDRQQQRIDDATGNSASHTWIYDNKPNGKGLLGTLSGYNSDGSTFTEEYTYNNLSLLETTTTTFDGNSDTVTQHYDNFSRPVAVTYPTGYRLVTFYNDYGYVQHLDDLDDGQYLWTANTDNARGSLTQFTLGNGIITDQTYDDATGRIDTIHAYKGILAIQDQDYDFDSLGNLTQRQDSKEAITQSFCYDGLNRLRAARFNGCSANDIDFDYDALGNITSKDGVSGNYAYGNNAGPNAVTSANGLTYQYDANGNLISARNGSNQVVKSVSYSAFNKPTVITNDGASSTLVYGPHKNRIMRTDSNGRTTRYLGSLYEETTVGGVTEQVHYLSDIGLYIIRNENNAVIANEHLFLHRDHIGSIVAKSGKNANSASDIEWLSNGPWGERRLASWDGPEEGSDYQPTGTARGFTDHEHLDSVGLIHMNGRVYDPLLGRFVSPDPFVQAPYNTQSYNRYSYVFNNPLSFTDPSGYCTTSSGADPSPGVTLDGTRIHAGGIFTSCNRNDSLPVYSNTQFGIFQQIGDIFASTFTDTGIYFANTALDFIDEGVGINVLPGIEFQLDLIDIDFRFYYDTPQSKGIGEVGAAIVGVLSAAGKGKLVPKDSGKVATKGGLRSADNVANGPKLAKQLRLQSANSPFTKSGHLTDDAIKGSREIIPSSAINNPAIPKGFSKYSTETFQSPSGNFQSHFYKNSKTGEVFYGNDYKVIFNSKSGG